MIMGSRVKAPGLSLSFWDCKIKVRKKVNTIGLFILTKFAHLLQSLFSLFTGFISRG